MKAGGCESQYEGKGSIDLYFGSYSVRRLDRKLRDL